VSGTVYDFFGDHTLRARRQVCNMDFLISCPCGHTLERHDVRDGCNRCTCSRNRVAALDAVIETIRLDSSSGLSNLFAQLESETAEAGYESFARPPKT
jgi:hypothetical protein